MADVDDDVVIISDSEDEGDKIETTSMKLVSSKTVVTVKHDTIDNGAEDSVNTEAIADNDSNDISSFLDMLTSPSKNSHQSPSSSTVVGRNSYNCNSEVQEVIDIDDDIEELIGSSQPIPKPLPTGKELAESALEDLAYKLKNVALDFSMKERNSIKTKLWEKLRRVNLQSDSVSQEVTDYLQNLTRNITEQPKSKWTKIKGLMSFLDSKRKTSKDSKPASSKPSSETPEERAARKKRERMVLLEKHLKKLEKKIEEWDHREVDLDDEKNSAYLVKTRMVNEYWKHYKVLCRENGCTYYTGRPIEKRLKLPDITKFPEINEAVEKFLNSKSVLYIPDFKNIYDIVAKTNDASRPPLLCKEDPHDEVHKTALSVFERVIEILQGRRRQDFQIAVPFTKAIEDPADHDEELRKKLEENKRAGESEKHVIDEFVKKQVELKMAATEVVDDDPDDSAEETDDEDEADDLSAEGVHSEGDEETGSSNDGTSGTKTVRRKEMLLTRDQVDDEDDDVDEDDDDDSERMDDSPPDITPTDVVDVVEPSSSIDDRGEERNGVNGRDLTARLSGDDDVCTSTTPDPMDVPSTDTDQDVDNCNANDNEGEVAEPPSKRLKKNDDGDGQDNI